MLNTKYSPPRAKHFGISLYDPENYWLRPYLDPEVAWTGTDNGAWDEYELRQYPDFSGWENVSSQKVNTPDTDDDLTAAGAVNRLLFVNLPPKCTIRIYTERGDLIRTIHRPRQCLRR